MPRRDPVSELHEAQRRYAAALGHRAAMTPGEPGYHRAVHEIGVAWTLLGRAQERLSEELRREWQDRRVNGSPDARRIV